jgi:hypothetical protein
MASPHSYPPVVVGITGAPTDGTVLRAGVSEAVLRNRPLRIVAATQATLRGRIPTGAAWGRLAAAADRVTTRRPALNVSTAVCSGTLVDVLATQSHTAECVVADRATGQAAAAYVRCPLLVVPEPLTSSAGPVLVAVDAVSADGDALLDHGFAAAAARGVPMRPIYVWTASSIAGIHPVTPLDLLAAHSAADRMLAEVLAGWSQKYPDVTVHRDEIRSRSVDSAVLRATDSASLAVVGARSRPAGNSRAVGKVTRTVIAGAGCPVVVVPLGDMS